MIEPKSQIYSILNEIDDVLVLQARPDVLKEIPCITFYIGGNTPAYVVDGGTGYQDIEVIIDVYGTNSKESGSLLVALESKMLDNGYRMVFCSDIPDDKYSHVTTRFNFII